MTIRVVRKLVILCLVAGLLLGAIVAIRASSSGSPASGVFQFQPPAQYGYPSPSDWTLTPSPVATAHREPQPQISITPCPSWAPTLIFHSDSGTYECRGVIPPDPKTGPVLASPSSR